MSRQHPVFSLLLCYSAVLAGQLQAQSAELGRTFWRGNSGEYSIEWSTANLKVTRTGSPVLIFDAAAMTNADWIEDKRIQPEGQSMYVSVSYRLLSVVGPYLSMNIDESREVFLNAEDAKFSTIDLDRISPRSLAPVSLTSIFPKEDIFAALMADRIIAKALPAGSKPNSLKELIEILQGSDDRVAVGGCDYWLPYEDPTHPLSDFAFQDVKNGKVAVRLSLSPDHFCHVPVLQLELWLPIPEAHRSWFTDAKERRSGLLMVDVPSDVSTSFEFSQEGK